MCISSLPQAKWNLQSLQQLSWDNEVWSFPSPTPPSLNLSIPQPLHPSTSPSLNLSILPSFTSPSLNLSTFPQPLYPSTFPFLNLSILHLSIPPSLHVPSTSPSLNLSIPQPLHPSTSPPFTSPSLHLSIPPPSHMHTQPVYHLTRQPLLLYLAHIVLVENARLLGHRAVRTIFPVETERTISET